jgi:RNA polymerase-binding transcription factor DksA
MSEGRRLKRKYKFDTICSDCGHPIKNEDVAFRVPEVYIPDYVERREIVISMTFCKECGARIKQHNKEGMPGAIRRVEQSRVIEESMKKAHDRRNK